LVVTYVNYEGEATGFGTVFGTMSFPLPESGATSGTCARKISIPALQISDGRVISSQGVLDLAARTFNGEIFEG
jgi:hypothetical protein